MTSFANSIFLSYPSIPSYPISSLQLRSLSFRNFRNPAAPYRSIPKAAGALKTTREGAWEKKIEDPLSFQLNTHDLDEDEQEERIATLVREIKEIFLSLRGGEISPSAYDTAWVARIPSMDDPKKSHFPTTLEWIMKNQLEDGSWGEPSFFLLYDRLVCTLSCVLTLTQWRQGDELVAKGLRFLQIHIQDLDNEKNTLRRTVGFEMIFPSMLNEAKSHGLNLPYDLPCMKRIIMLREEKKRRIPMEVLNSAPTPLLFSLEGMQELVQWDKILKLQSANGSISDSPSATVATYLRTHDSKCLEYLTYIVKRFEDHAPSLYPIDIYERNWLIDTIQRLGIDHHFRKEISSTLDFLYKNLWKDGLAWGSNANVTDIDDTCMGLRLLRLHGYPISPDVLECFKDDDDNFLCMIGETHKGISDIFGLYRFSQIAFPGEKILEQAKIFAEQYLMNNIKDNQVIYDKWAIKKALHKEIEWALKNPWKMSLPRLEVQEYISNYGENDLWIGSTIYRMYNINNPKYLELAKLEHNKLQAIHTREANSILLWWNSSGFDDYLVTQLNPKEIHLSICAALYESEFSTTRIAYTKWNCIESMLRDIFLSHESMEELKLFFQAINEWKPELVQVLPTKMKRVFIGAYDIMNELLTKAINAQGKDVFPYLHDLRKQQVQQYLNIREVKDTKQFENFEEYVDRVKRGLAVSIRLVPIMFFMGDVLTDNALKHLDHRSKIHEHLVSYMALLNMLTKEKAAVYLYMKEQNCSEQDAVVYIKEKTDEAFAELTHEYLKPNKHIPYSCRRLIFEHGRIIRFYLNKVSTDYIVAGMEHVYTLV